MEHSLVSIAKWEAKWCVPFLSKRDMTSEEMRDYVRCMTVTHNVDPNIFNYLTAANIEDVNRYMESPMTATFIPEQKTGKKLGEKVTSELIYYWMISLGIPFECQKWHINRLLMLIKVCNHKNKPPKKRSRREIASGYASLNTARRRQLGTRG